MGWLLEFLSVIWSRAQHIQHPGQNIQHLGHSFVDPFRNFEDEANQQSSWAAGEGSAHNAPVGGPSRDSLAALYRPPFVFMFHGTFEQVQCFELCLGTLACKFGLLSSINNLVFVWYICKSLKHIFIHIFWTTLHMCRQSQRPQDRGSGYWSICSQLQNLPVIRYVLVWYYMNGTIMT